MTASVSTPLAPPSSIETTDRARLWRLAGVLALAHVALMFGSFALQKVAPLGAGAAEVTAPNVTSSMSKGFTGGYLTCLSYLLLLVVASLFARLLRGRTDYSRWLCSVMVSAAGVVVAVTFAAMADLGSALYDGHHGASVETITMLVHAHWFGIFLSTAALGVFTLATGAAILVTGALPRWVGWSGSAVGLACVLAVAAAGVGGIDVVTLLWAAWFVALGVSALRRA